MAFEQYTSKPNALSPWNWKISIFKYLGYSNLSPDTVTKNSVEMGQASMMCSIVWICPQTQLGDDSAQILCRNCCGRPTLLLILFRLTQAFLGRSQPLDFEEGSLMNFFKLVDDFHSSDQHSAIQVGRQEGGGGGGRASLAAAQRLALRNVFEEDAGL